VCKIVEGLQDLIDFHSIADKGENVPDHLYNFSKHKWSSLIEALEFLMSCKFFNLFNKEHIKQCLFKKNNEKNSKRECQVKLKEYQKNEIIYFEENEATVILKGDVIMFSHEKDVTPGIFMAKFLEGDVLASQYNTDL